MPDGFQADPPRRSSERGGGYHRYSEVNLRRPDRQASGGSWIIIAVIAAFLSVGLIAFLGVGLFVYHATAFAPTATVAPTPAVAVDADVAALRGTWIATAVTIDGDKATNDDALKVKLAMEPNGFRLDLPTTQKQGDSWTIKADFKPDADGGRVIKKIVFLINDGSTIEAIYEVGRDIMRICMSQNGEPPPTDFSAEKGSGRTLLSLKWKEDEEP